MASKNSSTKSKDHGCVNIKIDDFIEIGSELDPEKIIPVWTKEQEEMVPSIITDADQIDRPIKYVAGLDISFVKESNKAVASMVIFDYDAMNIVAKISINCIMKIPYVSGYLAFREVPIFMKLIEIQQHHCSHFSPQVILIDGNGIWHPRRAGSASHFGILSGIPCFGVSKNILYVDNITRTSVQELLTEKAPEKDQYVEVKDDHGIVLGLAYNVTGSIKSAVYISVGHKITLMTACEIFRHVTRYRICEPIRQADLLSREIVATLS